MTYTPVATDWDLADRLCASCRFVYHDQHNRLAYLKAVGSGTPADVPDEAHWSAVARTHCAVEKSRSNGNGPVREHRPVENASSNRRRKAG